MFREDYKVGDQVVMVPVVSGHTRQGVVVESHMHDHPRACYVCIVWDSQPSVTHNYYGDSFYGPTTSTLIARGARDAIQAPGG